MSKASSAATKIKDFDTGFAVRGVRENQEKEIIILGDIELGGGTISDDFISDDLLSHLFDAFAKRDTPVDLVLNGDTFDFLKCPIPNRVSTQNTKHHESKNQSRRSDQSKKNDTSKQSKKSEENQGVKKWLYPRHITERVALEKFKLIYDSHRSVFTALSRFLEKENHTLYLIVGNHDLDLLFTEVQKQLKKYLSSNRVYICSFYAKAQVYIEHGHQYDVLCRVPPEKPFLLHKQEQILHYPFSAFGVIQNFTKMKEEHPFMQRVRPISAVCRQHPLLHRKVLLQAISYFLKSTFYYPLRHYADPTYSRPQELFALLIDRLRTRDWDIEHIIPAFREQSTQLPKHKIAVLGHHHAHEIITDQDNIIIHPDTWRDEYMLDEERGILTPKNKFFVHIRVKNNEPRWEFVQIPSYRKIVSFREALEDEKKMLEHVKKDEKEGFARLITEAYFDSI